MKKQKMEYEIRKSNFEDAEIAQKIVDLQNIVYANRNKSFSIAGMNFWYTKNPLGKVLTTNAFYGDKIVAHYALVPVKIIINKRESCGLLSMATVTHPEHRGKGLFKKLADAAYKYAAESGYEFVIGVANANSFPGFMKYFDFTFVSRLDVKWGWGEIKAPTGKLFSSFIDREIFNWRFSKSFYRKRGGSVFGKYGNFPFVKTYMGVFNKELVSNCSLKVTSIFRPLNLYIGLGADLKNGYYFNVPKFIKHSPFNLIFLDLTEGKLPKPTKENIFFQLFNFDVA